MTAAPRPVRLLYLSDIRFPLERANGIQTMETCHALATRGHEIDLLVRRDTVSPPRDPFEFYGLPADPRLRLARVTTWGTGALRRVQYLAAAAWHAAGRRADLVLTRDLGVAAVLLRLPPDWRPPLVYESHGVAAIVGAAMGSLLSTASPASTAKQRRLLRREQRVWETAEGYATITSALAADLEARFGPRRGLAVVPDGVRLAATRVFAPPAAGPTPTIVYAGHLYPWKGVETLLRALPHVPAARAVIVGGHPAEPDLERLRGVARALGLSARVIFTGLVAPPEVARHLAGADVQVLPNSGTTISARYTSPLKLFEYLAAGTPIVASDLPALREVLRDGDNALLVTPDDPEALAAAIRRVLSDRALAVRLARAAFDDAAAYTWTARAARLETLFVSVLADVRGGRPPR